LAEKLIVLRVARKALKWVVDSVDVMVDWRDQLKAVRMAWKLAVQRVETMVVSMAEHLEEKMVVWLVHRKVV
jgi:hypothetical protein